MDTSTHFETDNGSLTHRWKTLYSATQFAIKAKGTTDLWKVIDGNPKLYAEFNNGKMRLVL